MALAKDEITADLMWRYVEHLREWEASGEPVTFTRPELESLVDVLATASAVPLALSAEQSEERKTAVRHRVQESLGGAPAEGRAPSGWRKSPLRRFLRGNRVPAWKFGLATTAAAALAVALGTVGLWHRPAPQTAPVRVVKVPQGVSGIEPMEEKKVHQLLPRMVNNELSPQQEKNLMWHMLVCPGCYDEYARLKHQGKTAARIEHYVQR